MDGEQKVVARERRTRAEVRQLVAEFVSSGVRRSFCRIFWHDALWLMHSHFLLRPNRSYRGYGMTLGGSWEFGHNPVLGYFRIAGYIGVMGFRVLGSSDSSRYFAGTFNSAVTISRPPALCARGPDAARRK